MLVWAGAGAALFGIVLADTLARGPLTSKLETVNGWVGSLRDQGVPVHPVGRVLSDVGDYLVLLPLLFLAVGALFWVKAWRRALATALSAAIAPGLVLITQPVLTPLNRPMSGLDPLLVPDTASRPRMGGEHLFPSGHLVEATLDWGLVAFVALPVVLDALPITPAARFAWRRVGIVAWVLGFTLTAAGRILRQAHGYNDVLAGFGIGLALLFATTWLVRLLWPDEVVPRNLP